MKFFARKRYQQVSNFVFALALIGSTLTAAIAPFIFSNNASAVSSTVCASGCDYTSIQAAIDAPTTIASDVITVAAGDYTNVNINKAVKIQGAGAATTRIVGSDANANPVTFSTSGATLSGFTITHDYTPAELTAWNFNNNGVIFNQNANGNTLSSNTISKNRNGIYINNAQNNVISGNTVTNNRTGLNLTNNISGTQITGNNISNNWTLGIVLYQNAASNANLNTVNVSGNTFNQNWYTEVGVKDAGGTYGVLDLRNNTFTDAPVTYSTAPFSDTALNEPGFTDQKPVEFGGSAVKPAIELPTIRIYNSPLVSILYTLATPTNLHFAEFACGGVSKVNNITPTWDAVPGALSYNYRVTVPNGATYGPIPVVGTSVNGPFDSEGLSSFSVQAVGPNGSLSAWATPPCAISYDVTAPDVAITNPTAGFVNGTVDIRGTVTDANPHHYFLRIERKTGVSTWTTTYSNTFNDATSFTNKSLYSWTPSVDGTYRITLEARDAAGGTASSGNKDAGSTASVIVEKDSTQPTATISFPGIGSTATGFSVQYSEAVNVADATNLANYYLTNWPNAGGSGDLVGDATINYDATTHLATISFTNSNWYISAEQLWGVRDIHDLAGNLVIPNPTEQLSSPMVAPTAPGTPTTTNPSTSFSLNWTWSQATDPGNEQASGVVRYEYALVAAGSGTPSSWTSTNTTSATTVVANDGNYELYVRAIDWAGNVGDSAIGTVVVDTTGPAVDVNAATFTTNTFTVTGDVDADAQSVDVVITDGANNVVNSGTASYVPGETTWSYNTTLVDGTYTVTATAKDSLGNSKTASALITVAVPVVDQGGDQTPPVIPPVVVIPQTPQIIPQTAAVLGATTDGANAATTDGDADVEGASDDKTAAAATDNGGNILGLAWYWWILILAAIAVLAWGIIAGIRRRNQES